MKKLLLTLHVLFVLVLQPTFANLVESDCKYGNLTFHCYRPIYTTEQSCYLIKCEKNATDVDIPKYIHWNGANTYLTHISDSVFINCSALTTATINFGSSINSYLGIRNSCFENCTALHTLTFNITYSGTGVALGKKVFNNCTKLNSISITDAVTKFSGDSAFYGSSISEPIFNSKYFFHLPTTKSGTYSIPSGITTIGEYAFQDCHNITKIVIPNTVTTIEDYAFKNCTGLTSITFPSSVQEISSTAFVGCTNMSVTGSSETMTWSLQNGTLSINCTGPITSTPWEAFAPFIKEIQATGTDDSIGYWSLKNGILSINCTGPITSTPWEAFAPFIKEIQATGTDDSIGYWSLKNGVLAVSALEESKNEPWRKLKRYITSVELKNGVDIIPAEAFCDYSNIHSVSISSTVTTFRDKAFYNCSSLTSFTMPNSVDSVGKAVFYGCEALENIVLSDNITSLSSDYYKTSNSWGGTYEYYYGFFGNCSSLKSIVVPNNVKKIDVRAFAGCSSLTSVTIPNSVISVGKWAFDGCESLTSVILTASSEKDFCKGKGNGLLSSAGAKCQRKIQINGTEVTDFIIPDGVTSIGDYAFWECSSLTSITIPNSVTRIGDWAFGGCSSLSSITCEAETPPTVSSFTFYYIDLESITIYVPCGYVEVYEISSGWRDFTNIQEMLTKYSITIDVNDTQMGTAIVLSKACATALIYATPEPGFRFLQWSDGVSNNPRGIVLTQDTVLIAEFAEIPSYVVEVIYNTDHGAVNGQGTYKEDEEVTLTATANDGYKFHKWSNGVTDNPYTFIVKSNVTLEAKFTSTEGIEDVLSSEVYTTKVLRNGQVLILRNGKTYTMQGQEVK